MGNTGRSSFGLTNWLKEEKQKLQILGQFSHWLVVTNIAESCAVNHILKFSENVGSTEFKKFADHHKVLIIVKTAAPCRRLQNYLFTQKTRPREVINCTRIEHVDHDFSN